MIPATSPRTTGSMRTASVLAAALCLTAGFAAEERSASAASVTHFLDASALDRSWDDLHERFRRIAATIRSAGSLLESDLGVIRALLRDARAFNDANPDHTRALALELQLARWVGEDQARIGDLYAALSRLTDGDATLAISAFRYRSQNNLMDSSERLEAARDLLARFPGNREILREAVTTFQQALMYSEVIALLEPKDLDPASDAALLLNLAEAHFAEHNFGASLTVARSLAQSSGLGPALQRQVDSVIEDAERYEGYWQEEQALRAAESAADDLPRIVIETSRGPITLELFENEAPNTVANFISLAESDFYAGTRFHRFITNMMIQGGDPESRSGPGIAQGLGGPGYTIADEHGRPESRRHFRDSIAMAKTQLPDTAGSQFYLCHRPLPWLNDRHTVFGRVLEGHDVVRALRQDDEVHAVIVLRKRDHAYEPIVIGRETDVPVIEDPDTETPEGE